jgi:hypothetical protein
MQKIIRLIIFRSEIVEAKKIIYLKHQGKSLRYST